MTRSHTLDLAGICHETPALRTLSTTQAEMEDAGVHTAHDCGKRQAPSIESNNPRLQAILQLLLCICFAQFSGSLAKNLLPLLFLVVPGWPLLPGF
jgi:hypothetical protein